MAREPTAGVLGNNSNTQRAAARRGGSQRHAMVETTAGGRGQESCWRPTARERSTEVVKKQKEWTVGRSLVQSRAKEMTNPV